MDAKLHCVMLDDTVLGRWSTIASAKNLTSASEVALFLVDFYFSIDETKTTQTSANCVHCHRPLVWCCTTCQPDPQSSPRQSAPCQEVATPVDGPSQQVSHPKVHSTPGQSLRSVEGSPCHASQLPEDAPSQAWNSFDDRGGTHARDVDVVKSVNPELDFAEPEHVVQGSCASVLNDENPHCVLEFCEGKFNTELRAEEGTNLEHRRNAKHTPSGTTPVTHNFHQVRKRHTGVGLEGENFGEILCDATVQNNIAIHDFPDNNNVFSPKQKATASRKTKQSVTKNTNNSRTAKTQVQAFNHTLVTCHRQETPNVIISGNVPCKSEHFSPSLIDEWDKKSRNDSVSTSDRCINCHTDRVQKEDEEDMKGVNQRKEVTNKTVCFKHKGRPRSKLISGKYLGTLQKTNGETRFYSRFECAHCQKVFNRKRDFNSHVSTHYLTTPHICVKCGEGFQTRPELRQHKISTHSPGQQPEFICDQCPAQFKTAGRFRLHKRMHEQNRLFACKTCGFVASSKEALNSHRLAHRKTARVQCEYCGETKRVNNMQRHLLMHRGEKPHSCSRCDAAFRTPFDLKDHVQRRHSEVKPFSCDLCGKGFICSDNLKHHLLVHSGLKPFECSVCPSRFSRKDYLTKHIRTHTGEKPYQCPDCGEAFAYPNGLKLHIKQIHSS